MSKNLKSNNTLRPFLRLIGSVNISKKKLILGLFGALSTTCIGLAIPLLTKQIVDGFSQEIFSGTVLIVIGLVFILQVLTEGISIYFLAYIGHEVVAALRERMWSKMLKLPIEYYDQKSSGESVSRIVNDTGIVKDLITHHFPQFISGIITLLGAIIILLVIDWKMTLLMLLSVPITLLIMLPLGFQMTRISKGLQDETAHFAGSVQQTLSEMRLMKASNAEQKELDKGKRGISNLFQYGLKEAKIFALISPLIYLTMMLAAVMIIGYGGIRVAAGSLTTGSLVAFLLYLFQVIFPISSFAMFFTNLQKAKGASERMVEILSLNIDEHDSGIDKEISDLSLSFKSVSFSYNSDSPVLSSISFEANPGEVLAFVGPSGGGKTTLFNLIERFYNPNNGEICIGETSIFNLSLKSWRGQVGLVSQDSPMMAGTIRENLCYGLEEDSISDEQLWRVAKMAYADDFIEKFPDQLGTQVGERGIKLSGGQRQRIAIARAFLRDPRILLMDEATASLDSHSEKIVQKALARLMVGRTTLIIAHRLSTILNADQILFIEEGEITGKGTHKELIDRHALYREYAHQQLKPQVEIN